MTTQPDALRSDIAFSPAVKAAQAARGSRDMYARALARRDFSDRITDDLAEFIGERDSFYLATASGEGQPYIQHRGGPRGFLKVLDAHRLAFADYAGNRQYITVGHLDENPRAFIFLMDYQNRRRVKVWGRAEVIENDPELLAALADPEYEDHGRAPRLERAIVFTLEAWDVNCPQHIRPRYTAEDMS